MESSAAVHSEVRGFARAEDSPRRRLVILIAAVIVAFGVAFALGSATKSTPTAHGGASLAPAVSLSAPHAAVTALKAGPAVPALKAVAKKHSSSTSAQSASASATPAATTSVTPSNNTAVTPPPSSNTQSYTPAAPTQASKPSQPTSTGVSHGGG